MGGAYIGITLHHNGRRGLAKMVRKVHLRMGHAWKLHFVLRGRCEAFSAFHVIFRAVNLSILLLPVRIQSWMFQHANVWSLTRLRGCCLQGGSRIHAQGGWDIWFFAYFCIVSCVSASGPRIARRPWKRRGRFPAGRTCIFKRLKGSLFWCLFNSESPANIATSCVSPESAIHTCEASHFELHESNDCQDL